MNAKKMTSMLAISAIAALALAPAAQAKALKPGNYNLAGLQQICLVSGGTWYGETYPSWSGTWGAGPTREDATLLSGNYNGGAGNDSMIVTGSNVDWTEWNDASAFIFIDSTITRIAGKCTAPDARATTKKHPMD